MAEISYLDFDLLIEPFGKKYRARVLNSPAGQATTDFRLPLSDLELDNFLLLVGRTSGGVRRIDSLEWEATKTFGGRLFDAVFTVEVRACLRSSLDEASRQGLGLRIRLRLTDVPELADLPWEYLYNSATKHFLTLSAETPLVRYLDLPERIQPLAVKPPLRVLAMISSPSDYPQLDVEQEWTNLKNALGDLEQRSLVVLERLEEATLAALQRRLRQAEYHIFHFIGHGGFDQQVRDGVLVLEDEAKQGRQVSGQYLGTLLHDHRPLRLVILNACEGARTSRTDPFAGTAQSLVQQGIPAVIAMQFAITDEAAITFSHEFYCAVADGYPVDAALAEARKAIFAQGNDVEWGTPVLYMRSPDGRIFDIATVQKEVKAREAVTPPTTALPADRFAHDVFISYSHNDKDWVYQRLLPSLEAAGLKVCIDFRDFEPGLPSLINMENAVERSRKTLIVLTPAWVESEWTAFESLLIQTDDPAARQRRIIPLLLTLCQPPKRIAILTYLDFTDPNQFDFQMGRLIKAVKG